MVLVETADEKSPSPETLGVRSQDNICVLNMLETAFS
jgi:hypothetical protein